MSDQLTVTDVPLLVEGQASPEVTVNASILMLASLAAAVTSSITPSDTPPGSPADEGMYLTGTSPTGAWAGHASCLAIYKAGWYFIPFFTGLRVAVGGTLYVYNGTTFVTPGTAAPGMTTHVVFNDGGSLGAESDMRYDKTANELIVNGFVQVENSTTSSKGFKLTGGGYEWRWWADSAIVGMRIGGSGGVPFWSARWDSGPANEFTSASNTAAQELVRAKGTATQTGKLYTGYKDSTEVFYVGPDGDVSAASLTASKRIVGAVVALSDGATINTDASLGNEFTVTLGGNRTMAAPSNPVAGQRITYRVKQDGTGSRTLSWTTGSSGAFRFSGGTAPTLTTTAGKTDYIGFEYNGTDSRWDCVAERLNF